MTEQELQLRAEAAGWEQNAREMAGFQAETCLRMASMKDELDRLRRIEVAAKALLLRVNHGGQTDFMDVSAGLNALEKAVNS